MNELNRWMDIGGINSSYGSGSYPLPRAHPDVLDIESNFSKYVYAKRILEHVEVNPILENIKAFDSINPHDIDTYYNMAKRVAGAVEYYNSTSDNPVNIKIEESVIFDCNDKFLLEFLLEFYSKNAPAVDMNSINSIDQNKEEDAPAPNFIQKLMKKMGIDSGIALKDFIYLYLIKQFNDSGESDSHIKPSPKLSMGEGIEVPVEFMVVANIIKSELLENNDGEFSEIIERELKLVSEYDQTILNQDHLNDINPHQLDMVAPKVDATVKSDIKKRISEVNKLIDDYNKDKHFANGVKPVIFNVKTTLEFLLDGLNNMKNMSDYKELQIYFQKLMSPITDLYPPSLVKFLSTGANPLEK